MAILAGLLATPAEAQRTRQKSKKTHSELRGDLQKVRGKRARLAAELRTTKRQAKVVFDDLKAVESRLDHVQSALADTSDRLESNQKEQKTVGEELAQATADLARCRAQVTVRMRRMYMRGTGNFLSALAGTQSVGDLASRKFLMETIARKDRDVFTEYRALAAKVRDRKTKQDALVRRTADLMVRQRSQAQDLKQAQDEKGEVLHGLRERQGELQKLIAQFDADEREIAAEIAAYARRSHAGGADLPAFTGRFSRPVDARMTSTFGMRFHPIFHQMRMHTGVDFGASVGTPIHAAADGLVVATSPLRGYGNVVIIDHGGGISTVYAHTSRFFCAAGQRVTRGQTIAAVGMTGYSTGPHLHFEVRVNGHAVNPLGRL